MDKRDAIALIDAHKNKLSDPVEMLDWAWLRVIVDHVPVEQWDEAVGLATIVMSR